MNDFLEYKWISVIIYFMLLRHRSQSIIQKVSYQQKNMNSSAIAAEIRRVILHTEDEV